MFKFEIDCENDVFECKEVEKNDVVDLLKEYKDGNYEVKIVVCKKEEWKENVVDLLKDWMDDEVELVLKGIKKFDEMEKVWFMKIEVEEVGMWIVCESVEEVLNLVS